MAKSGLAPGTIAAVLLVAFGTIPPALSAAARGGLDDVDVKTIKVEIQSELVNRGLTLKRILPCREVNPRKLRCEWRVEGTYTDGPEYSCRGYATYTIRQSTLQVDDCLNAQLWDLLIERGLQPKAILNGHLEGGVWSFEWRARGARPGDVPYRCRDVARYDTRTGEWTLGKCANSVPQAEPLLDRPGPPPAFGFNDDWTDRSTLTRLDQAAAIGARVARFTVGWPTIEPQSGQFNWGPYDRIVATMLADGVQPFLVVLGTPCWAQANATPPCSTEAPPDSSHVDDFARFTAALAAHYPQAFAIEIWNEPNSDFFFQPKPDPALYGSMLRRAAAAVHAGGSGVPVVMAGNSPLANTTLDGTRVAFDEFLRGVFRAGGIGSADAIGAHVYFGDVNDFVLKMRQQIARIRAILNHNGEGALPLWITEYGVSSTEETDEQGQATILVDLYDAFRHIANLPVVIVHRFVEGTNPATGGVDHRGVVEANGQPKPAYCALGHAVGVVPASC